MEQRCVGGRATPCAVAIVLRRSRPRPAGGARARGGSRSTTAARHRPRRTGPDGRSGTQGGIRVSATSGGPTGRYRPANAAGRSAWVLALTAVLTIQRLPSSTTSRPGSAAGRRLERSFDRQATIPASTEEPAPAWPTPTSVRRPNVELREGARTWGGAGRKRGATFSIPNGTTPSHARPT